MKTGGKEIRFRMTQGIAGDVARTQVALNIKNPYADPRYGSWAVGARGHAPVLLRPAAVPPGARGPGGVGHEGRGGAGGGGRRGAQDVGAGAMERSGCSGTGAPLWRRGTTGGAAGGASAGAEGHRGGRTEGQWGASWVVMLQPIPMACRFNSEIDRQLSFKTHSILAFPVVREGETGLYVRMRERLRGRTAGRSVRPPTVFAPDWVSRFQQAAPPCI